jgi:hypothetical protein
MSMFDALDRLWKHLTQGKIAASFPLKFVSHSAQMLKIAMQEGWLPTARYTNLRDVRDFQTLGFIDIDWKNDDFKKHIETVRSKKPLLTVAKDVEAMTELNETIHQGRVITQILRWRYHCAEGCEALAGSSRCAHSARVFVGIQRTNGLRRHRD